MGKPSSFPAGVENKLGVWNENSGTFVQRIEKFEEEVKKERLRESKYVLYCQ